MFSATVKSLALCARAFLSLYFFCFRRITVKFDLDFSKKPAIVKLDVMTVANCTGYVVYVLIFVVNYSCRNFVTFVCEIGK